MKEAENDFDSVAKCKYDISSYWDIGKVYARAISNYNSDFYYQSETILPNVLGKKRFSNDSPGT